MTEKKSGIGAAITTGYDELRRNSLRASQLKSNLSKELVQKIYFYYEERGLVWPTFEEAREWARTEEAEVSEQWLASRSKKWVRNNPEKHSAGFSQTQMIEELADQTFMLIIAGMVMGFNVLDVMSEKMDRKLKEHREKIQRSE
jgi:hypothetical protein